jgi:hypothetical protein
MNRRTLIVAAVVLCFSGVLLSEGNAHAAKEVLLYDLMKDGAVLDSTKDFDYLNGAGADDTGIYIEARTADDEYPVYYYRGLPNNNLIYAGFCWQVLRTTSLGNIKLIYNGLPTCETCVATGNDTNTLSDIPYAASSDNRIYGGYVYELDGEEHDSTAKAALDEWFAENLEEHLDDLADDVWCNRTDWEDNHHRIGESGTPSNECPDEAAMSVSYENGNGKLVYPVGMITADELMFGGAGYNVENHNYYLTTGNKFHSMTQQSEKKMYYQNSKYALNRTGSLTYATGIRAIIAVPNNTTVQGGDGSKNNPWRITMPKYKAESVSDLVDVENTGVDGLYAEGDTVRIVPKEGRIDSVIFYNDDDEEVDIVCTVAADGSCSFVMPDYNVHFDVIIAENPATGDNSARQLMSAMVAMLVLVGVGAVARRR